ncbi:hypothetical protein BAX96_14525 [Elizabethkingia anophelis]|uniref:DUF1016 N-terminal domain-containing protein n=1 Tax=Elizabethkingia anophelis TaxID=1117645 RepID=UPI0009993013|nr:DUF1016 domain-containing protein [Elizabethkingia anophelis]OPC18534.1 hypothetical protein BAX96_14525 [Elizabethkingia anophelis]
MVSFSLNIFTSEELQPEYGSGFSKRQKELFRQFYRTFPNTNTLYSQLNWNQDKIIVRLEIDFFIAET